MSTECPLRLLRLARFVGLPIHWCHSCFLAARRGLRNAFYATVRMLFAAALTVSFPALISAQAGIPSVRETIESIDLDVTNNLREQIPKQYSERYNRWKTTFLSVDFGRQLWLRYAVNPAFSLTIIVSKRLGKGARVDDYKWVEGKLVAATITLGHQLDQGYPCQVLYPVIGSLPFTTVRWDDRDDAVLAAAKIAHEFGHIVQAANTDAAIYQTQNALSGDYNSRLLLNGHNTEDPVLIELAGRMGGTPLEIKSQREYWAESYALRYLLCKLAANRGRELKRWVQKTLASESPHYSLPAQIGLRHLTSYD